MKQRMHCLDFVCFPFALAPLEDRHPDWYGARYCQEESFSRCGGKEEYTDASFGWSNGAGTLDIAPDTNDVAPHLTSSKYSRPFEM